VSKILVHKTLLDAEGQGLYGGGSMRETRIDHHVQAAIFAKLRYSESLRYKELKDPTLEPSQFMYHLKSLIGRDLVMKNLDGSYSLTGDGRILAQYFSSEVGNIRLGILTYSLLFLRSNRGNWLVLKRKKQPHINRYACISGKVHIGETVDEAARRELGQHVSTNDIKLHYAGSASVLVNSAGTMTQIYGPVWFADGVDESRIVQAKHASSQWVDWQKLPYDEFIPGWKEIVSMIESGMPQLLDLKFDMQS
jgi:hypothetical protein